MGQRVNTVSRKQQKQEALTGIGEADSSPAVVLNLHIKSNDQKGGGGGGGGGVLVFFLRVAAGGGGFG